MKPYNETFGKLFNHELERCKNSKLKDVINFTKIDEVLETGQASIGRRVSFQQKEYIVTEETVIKDDVLLGGLIKAVSADREIYELSQRLHYLENQLIFYRDELKRLVSYLTLFDVIVGQTEVMQKLKRFASKVALTDATVLITGESGTGKELLANAIHNASRRCGEPFIKINCAAIPENLLESELFGYEEGAFTGAVKGGKPGKFELANGGTIFLDEIGDMPLAMQAKLLRVLQDKVVERIGGTKSIKVDVRVIAATNRDLNKLIEEKQFRLDLNYRLAVINLSLPSLKERKADLPLILERIIERLNHR